MKSTTPSYILQLKLNPDKSQTEHLRKVFLISWRIYNILVMHCRKQLHKLMTDKQYRDALTVYNREKAKNRHNKSSKPNPAFLAAKEALSERTSYYGLRQFDLEAFEAVLQHKYSRYINSAVGQKLADTCFSGVAKVLYGDGHELHFKRFEDFFSIEGKSNSTGITYNKGICRAGKQNIQVSVPENDIYAQYALMDRVKYCRIVRIPVGSEMKFFLQLVLEGIPPQKHCTGKGRSGIDIGTSTVAETDADKCILKSLSVKGHPAEIARLQRKLDRSRRAMNPGNFNPDGTVKKGRKSWTLSNTYRKDRQKLKVLHYKDSQTLKQAQETIANEILESADDVYVEHMDMKALAKKSKKTKKNKKGRFQSKKRFGKSIQKAAPAQLISAIDRKLHYQGKEIHKVDTWAFKASQYDHVSDDYVKKRLSMRHAVIDGNWVQRDLYSSFLLMNSSADLTHADRERCISSFSRFMGNHDICIQKIKDSGMEHPKSFGF